ncbi:MAG: hypothetical protein ABIK85_10280 [Candidatus Eisenbacteria bacterium]|jgi:hypothetical protein
MDNLVFKLILALLYLFAGLGLILGRRRLVEGGKPPNLALPAALLILAAIITPFL